MEKDLKSISCTIFVANFNVNIQFFNGPLSELATAASAARMPLTNVGSSPRGQLGVVSGSFLSVFGCNFV